MSLQQCEHSLIEYFYSLGIFWRIKFVLTLNKWCWVPQKNKGSKNSIGEVSKEETVTLTKEDYAKLHTLLKGKSPDLAQVIVVYFLKNLLHELLIQGPQIIWLRITDFFSSFNTCSNVFVTLANGSSTKVIVVGTANTTPSLSLVFSLYVPQFPLSLLFMSKLTNSLNCFVSFFLLSIRRLL